MAAARPAPCLHCTFVTAVNDHYRAHGAVDPATGMRVVDLHEAIAKIAEALSDLIETLPSRPQRRAATKYAHDCLDAARVHARTGVPQPVISEAAGTEH